MALPQGGDVAGPADIAVVVLFATSSLGERVYCPANSILRLVISPQVRVIVHRIITPDKKNTPLSQGKCIQTVYY